MESPLTALFQLIDAFKTMGIDYVVVGSIASSVHGDYRSSADVDVLAKMSVEHVAPLVKIIAKNFYVDDVAAVRAIKLGRSFNVIHLLSVFKIDIFVPTNEFDNEQLARRELQTIETETAHEIWIATAEDTILAKLRWFQAGSEVSELQWRDVKGILATQKPELDFAYLRSWAERIGVSDLLGRALEETE
jgi:hypothetical protein